MKNVIIIRYSEIHLKGKNRGFFEKLLVDNIKNSLKDFGATLSHISGRYIVSNYPQISEEKIIEALCCVSGIFSVSPAVEVASTLESITAVATNFAKNLSGTFKVETNRADKSFALSSMEVSRKVGGDCLAVNHNLTVNVTEPEHKICIDIRESGNTYIYERVVFGVGGMPVGSSGNGLLLLSGGIDSPVAGYMMAKRGVKVHAIHFHSFPYTSPQAKEKVLKLAKIISKYTGQIELSVVSVTKIQQEIHKNCKADYMITVLRRFMFEIAEKLANAKGLNMLITGESLGQVASQTIESMTVVEDATESIVVARPLIAFDKYETIEISKKIGTYETSIEPFEDCCTVFLPKNPVTRPKLKNVLFEEKHLDKSALIDEALATVETIII